MEGDGSPLSSLCMVRAEELFPKHTLEKDDEQLKVPLTELAGESVKYLGHTDDGILAISNYRFYLLKTSTGSEISVPLGLIESATTRELFNLIISCKDASTVKCSFSTSEQCSEWLRRILLHIGIPERLESLFAFPFYAWSSEKPSSDSEWAERLQRATKTDEDFYKEVERLGFNTKVTWRICHANYDFKLCPSYPRLLMVPCGISDEVLHNVSSFRSSRRIPAVVWRHKASGAILARCSQPEVGWLGWRNANDELMIKAIVDACAFDKGELQRKHNYSVSSDSQASSPEGSHDENVFEEPKKLLIIDARSYTSAVTNRARGGGCECPEYYTCADIEFMNLGNIHTIRKSFHQLRQLCASPPDNQNWLSSLERSFWLQHLAGLLAASINVCHAIERCGRPVLVHCSDGWDRTPQILATAQLCMDPFYRTVDGFRILVEREWLNFGHKFADRCGHGPNSEEVNERCPVFLQWLDAVHQIHRQFPCSFEFSMGYLIKLAQHSHSCIFGTFLCNTLKDRIGNTVFERTFSVWSFLSGPIYKNPLYVANKERVLWPAHHVRDLVLWSEVYLGSLGNLSDYPPDTNDVHQDIKGSLIKTRSYGDLLTLGGHNGGLIRRSSDPNMTAESHFGVHLPTDPSIETMSDNGILGGNLHEDEIAHFCSDSSKELDYLTAELKQADGYEQFAQMQIQRMHETNTQHLGEDEVATSQKCDSNNRFYDNESDDTSPCYSQLSESLEKMSKNVCGESQNHHLRPDINSQPVQNYIHDNTPTIHNKISHDVIDGVNLQEIEPVRNEVNSYSDMLHSVNLNETFQSQADSQNTILEHQQFWHGNVETSTDTLIPNEQYSVDEIKNDNEPATNGYEHTTNTITDSMIYENHDLSKTTTSAVSALLQNTTSTDMSSIYCNKGVASAVDTRHRQVSPQAGKMWPQVHNNSSISKAKLLSNSIIHNNSVMDESILIQPEFQRMDISNGGHMEVSNIINTTASSHRRRRNSSNSRQENSPHNQVNGSISPSVTNSRSLPLTPPAQYERINNVAISCPDGLAHALSEQNLRLQQIVHEHKIREEALQRELYATRLALQIRNSSVQGQNQQMLDDPPGMIDNAENASVCSWEAVDEQRGIAASTGSGSSANLSGSVLWVPDHAVSQCTSCQTEFWLGRRKHHCRSCGQIFCADCSEFWAALPDERLYQPVRLCGPCYHTVTTKIQQDRDLRQQQDQSVTVSTSAFQPQMQQQYHLHNQYHPNNTSIEPCKHAAGSSTSDQAPRKATTASN